MADRTPPYLRWSVRIPDSGDGMLTVTDDGVLLSGSTWLERYARSGERRWLVVRSARSLGEAVLLRGDLVAWAEADEMVVRDLATGVERHRWAIPAESFAGATPWGDVALLDHTVLRCFDPDGRPRWDVALGPEATPPFAVGDLVVAGHGGALVAYDRDGSARWAVGGDGLQEPGALARPAHAVRPPLRIDRDRVLVALLDQVGLTEIDARGPSVRTVTGWGGVTGFAAVPGGGFVVTGAGEVQLIDVTGAALWTWQAPGPITHPAVAGPDGAVYVGAGGRLHCLSTVETGPPGADLLPAVPLSRTDAETDLFFHLTGCPSCGEFRFPRTSADVDLPDGSAGRRYTGTCPSCGVERIYLFRLADNRRDLSGAFEHVYGYGSEPSELLDAGQWVLLADRHAASLPDRPHRLRGEERRNALERLMVAAAAAWEAEKFLPQAPEVSRGMPPTAFRTEVGWQTFLRDPSRFDEPTMSLRRHRYERDLRDLADYAPEPVRQRMFEAEREWEERYGVTTGFVMEDEASRQPTPEQLSELRHRLRVIRTEEPEPDR